MTMIPINKPWLDEEERHEVMSVLDENALTTGAHDGGKRVRDFESRLRGLSESKICHSCQFRNCCIACSITCCRCEAR